MKKPSLREYAGRFRFVTDCISSTFEDIRDLIDNDGDVGITMRTFALAVGPEGWRQLSSMLNRTTRRYGTEHLAFESHPAYLAPERLGR